MSEMTNQHVNEDGSTMSKLASFLQEVGNATGKISLPSSLYAAIEDTITAKRILPEHDLVTVVQALDSNALSLCSRLNVEAFVAMYAIFRMAESCWTQQRGLCLLSEGVEPIGWSAQCMQPSIPPSVDRPLFSRKACIGSEILCQSVGCLCDATIDDGARRWMGLLALALLRDCNENVQKIRDDHEERRHFLGQMVIEDLNEQLRFIAGSIIRQLISCGVSEDSFWPIHNDLAPRADFFEDQLSSLQWLQLFKEYLDEIDSQLDVHPKRCALFSYSLRLDETIYNNTAPSFLVTLHQLLSIVIPDFADSSGKNRTTQYIDIPLENIDNIEIVKSTVKVPTSLAEQYVGFAVILNLSDRYRRPVFVNAAARLYRSVELVFDNGGMANTLKSLILEKKTTIKQTRRAGHMVYDASQVHDDQRESNRKLLSTPKPRPISKRAVLLSTVPPIPGSKGLDHPPESHDGVASPRSGDPDNLHAVEYIAASAIRILDTSRPWSTAQHSKKIEVPKISGHSEIVSHGASIAAIHQDVFDETPSEVPVLSFEEEFSEIIVPGQTKSRRDYIATSSNEWRDGAQVIEDAPELLDGPNRASSINDLQDKLHEGQRLASTIGQDGRNPGDNQSIEHIKNHNKVSSTAATDLRAISEQLEASAKLRNRGDSKISGRLLKTQAKRINQSPAIGGIPRSKKPVKAVEVGSAKQNSIVARKSASKKRTTVSNASKISKQVELAHDEEDSTDQEETSNVYEIPTSPSRSARLRAKAKSKKEPVTKASRPVKSKPTSKSSKVKQGIRAPRNKSSNKPSVKKPPRTVEDRNFILNTDREDEIDLQRRSADGAGGDIVIGGEEEQRSTTESAAKASIGLTTENKETGPEERLSPPAKRKPLNTTVDEPKGKTSKHRKPIPAVLGHLSTRRAAAIKANLKIQGLDVQQSAAETVIGDVDDTLRNTEDVPSNDSNQQGVEESAQSDTSLLANESKLNAVGVDQNTSQEKRFNRQDLSTLGHAERLEQAPGNQNDSVGGLPNVLCAPRSVEPREVNGADCSLRDDGQKISTSEPLPVGGEPHSPGEAAILNSTGVLPGLPDNHPRNSFGDVMTSTAIKKITSLQDPLAGQEIRIQATDFGPVKDHSAANTCTDNQQPPTGSVQGLSVIATAVMVSRPVVLDASPGVSVSIAGSKTCSGADQNSHIEPDETVKFSTAIENVPTKGQSTSLISQIDASDSSEASALEQTSTIIHATTKARCLLTQVCEEEVNQEDRFKQAAGGAITSSSRSDVVYISSGAATSSEDGSERAPVRITKANDPLLQISGKRKSDSALAKSPKRIKLSSLEDYEPHITPEKQRTEEADGSEVSETVDVVATDDYVQRKANIIGFSSKGPRNQGVISEQKSRAHKDLRAARDPVLESSRLFSAKRKHPEDQAKAESLTDARCTQKAPVEKRRRTVNVVPPTPVNGRTVFHRSRSPYLPTISRRVSSQASRVQDNGSPVATVDQLSRVSGTDMQSLLRRLAGTGYHVLEAEDKSTESDMWRLQGELSPQRLKYQQPLGNYERPSSSRMKLQPSSPTAPSRMIADMAAHHIQPDGHFIDVRTANIVHVAEPPDPFIDYDQKTSNSFIKKLRASTTRDRENKGQESGEPELTLHGITKTQTARVDPDLTLVEMKNKRRSRQSPSSEGGPSSSHSSKSTYSKAFAMPSDSEAGAKREEQAREWKEALRPYQKQTLMTLQAMSNRLINRLLDKESAVRDMTKDYTDGGNKLINELKTAHDHDQKTYGHKVETIKQSLTTRYGTLKSRFGKELKGVKRQSIREMQVAWSDGKQRVQKQLEAAISAYGGT